MNLSRCGKRHGVLVLPVTNVKHCQLSDMTVTFSNDILHFFWRSMNRYSKWHQKVTFSNDILHFFFGCSMNSYSKWYQKVTFSNDICTFFWRSMNSYCWYISLCIKQKDKKKVFWVVIIILSFFLWTPEIDIILH